MKSNSSPQAKAKNITTDQLLIAIRQKCLDCCGNSMKEVERCRIGSCALHPYRNRNAAAEEYPTKVRKKEVKK